MINRDTKAVIASGARPERIPELVEIKDILNLDVGNPVVAMDQARVPPPPWLQWGEAGHCDVRKEP